MICWLQHNGQVGGYPVKITTYWEGMADSITHFWITPLSNGEWHLVNSASVASRRELRHVSNVSIRDRDCEKLKKTANSLFSLRKKSPKNG